MKKKSNLTASQQEIVNNLINEFETLNRQQNDEHSDLFAYIEGTLNTRKRTQEEIKKHNDLQTLKMVELFKSWIADVQPLLDRYNIKAEHSKTISSEMLINFKFMRGETYVANQYVKFHLNFERIEDVIKFNDIKEIHFQLESYTFYHVTRETLPKMLADKIIQVGKNYKMYI